MAVDKFRQHPLVRGGQIQTMLGHFTSNPSVPTDHEVVVVNLDDGDQLQLHIDYPQKVDEQKPLVLILHGLGGCSESKYILRISEKLNNLGYIAIRYNHRGCGRGGLGLAQNIYHAGRTEDIKATLRTLDQKFKGRSLNVAAFSLSANMLLLLQGMTGNLNDYYQHGNVKTMAVCPPLDLELCSQALSAWSNLLIDRYYTRLLIGTAKERARVHSHLEAPLFPPKMSLRIFDEVYTTPNAGFATVDDYYSSFSSKPHLKNIANETTIVAADDDPIIPKRTFDNLSLSSTTQLFVQRGGGHMGFISQAKTRFGDHRWMDDMLISWVESGF